MQERTSASLHFIFSFQPEMKTLLKYWPTALVVLVILYATWVPHPLPDDEIPPIPHVDKLIHAIMMGGLAAALMFDYYRSSAARRLSPRAVILFVAVAMGFSVVDEVVQGLLPIGRPSDPLDLLADWTGCFVAAIAAPPAIKAVVRRRPVR